MSASSRLRVGVLKEPGDERRVALTPDAVAPLRAAGMVVEVEVGAGEGSWFSDDDYLRAGATVVEQALEADLVVTVGTLPVTLLDRLHRGQVVVGMLHPLSEPQTARHWADRGVTAISLDMLPRTLSRAQSMDALTSQANVAGYKAVLVAAGAFGRFFPLLITAAGTAKPAEVLVLGAGVAGLQAMGTARRLGAVVTGYDVRPETGPEIRSVGARHLQLRGVAPAEGEGGYARALTPEEQRAQQDELDTHVVRFDVVITTAQIPGRRPPVLVTANAIKHMRPGAVVVDLAASALGGNVEGSLQAETVVTDNGVTIIGAGNLPSQVPTAASVAFSHNVTAMLLELIHDGQLHLDLGDEIQAGAVVAHDGRIVNPTVAGLVESSTTARGDA